MQPWRCVGLLLPMAAPETASCLPVPAPICRGDSARPGGRGAAGEGRAVRAITPHPGLAPLHFNGALHAALAAPSSHSLCWQFSRNPAAVPPTQVSDELLKKASGGSSFWHNPFAKDEERQLVRGAAPACCWIRLALLACLHAANLRQPASQLRVCLSGLLDQPCLHRHPAPAR